MSRSLQQSIALLVDVGVPEDERAKAAQELAGVDDASVREALVRVASRPTPSAEVARTAGSVLAGILFRAGDIADAPLEGFAGEAYLAFDAEARRLMLHES